ncbi:hypothetical protein [Nocardioides sp.]|uniref:hypothetical protein n=1 Tax=Nocardioides sp. TaxID=35761 RepID=UPI0035147714
MRLVPSALAGKRPSAPMIVSTAALVVALGGTSYAATQIRTADIADNAVTSAKIKDGAVKTNDLAKGVIKSGPQGPQGDAGPRGPKGDTGDTGPAGVGRWALINPAGQIAAQSGGFEILAAYPTLPDSNPTDAIDDTLRANGNVYLDANEPLGNNGLIATIMLQNTTELDVMGAPGFGNTNGRAAGADANPEFSGEISVSRCTNFTPAPPNAVTNCAPTNARNAEAFVVSPRNSDGSVTVDGSRKWFYVVITGDSSDYVAPTPAP